jgi:hypothetical protein
MSWSYEDDDDEIAAEYSISVGLRQLFYAVAGFVAVLWLGPLVLDWFDSFLWAINPF